MQQVISIAPDGIISGLQHKPGKGVDLRAFGPATIERVSEIMPTDDGQRWFVEIKTGPLAGRRVTTKLLSEARILPLSIIEIAKDVDVDDGLLTFGDYDEAVKVEIKVLDALRVKGVF